MNRCSLARSALDVAIRRIRLPAQTDVQLLQLVTGADRPKLKLVFESEVPSIVPSGPRSMSLLNSGAVDTQLSMRVSLPAVP